MVTRNILMLKNDATLELDASAACRMVAGPADGILHRGARDNVVADGLWGEAFQASKLTCTLTRSIGFVAPGPVKLPETGGTASGLRETATAI